MKQCTILGIEIPNDTTGKLTKTVNQINSYDRDVQTILASYFRDGDFKEYCFNDERVKTQDAKTFEDIDTNTLKSLLKNYYNEQNPGVKNYAVKKNAETLLGFSSATAKLIAIDETSRLLLNEHRELLDSGQRKLSKEEKIKVINRVRNKINDIFIKNYALPLANKLKNKNGKKGEKANDVLDAKEKLKFIENLYARYNELFDKKDAKTITDEEKEELNKIISDLKDIRNQNNNINIKDYINSLRNELYLLCYNLCNEFGEIVHKNYANLANQLRANPNEWFEKVLNGKRLVEFKKDFNSIIEGEDFYDSDFQDETDFVNYDNDTTIDEMSKNWEDTLYSSYEKNVDIKIRMYLDSLYDLTDNNVSFDKDGKPLYSYNTNNELGVARTVDAKFLISQLSHHGRYYSVEDFIESVGKLSNIAGCEALIQMYNDMRRDRAFANMCFCALANPKLSKCIINITAEGFDVYQSNEGINPITYNIYKMFNSVKNKFNDYYDIEDLNKVRKLHHTLENHTKEDDIQAQIYRNNFIKTKSNIEFDEYIESIFNKYFPDVDIKTVYAYLYNTDNSTVFENYLNLISNLNDLMNVTYNAIKSYNSANEIYREEIKEWRNQAITYDDFGEEIVNSDKPAPKFNDSQINYDAIYVPVIAIAKKLYNFSSVKSSLNTANAEGKTASDLGKNNYITNLIS